MLTVKLTLNGQARRTDSGSVFRHGANGAKNSRSSPVTWTRVPLCLGDGLLPQIRVDTETGGGPAGAWGVFLSRH